MNPLYYGIDIARFVARSGYETKDNSITECLRVIEENHVDVTQFYLPEEFQSFLEYADYLRQDDIAVKKINENYDKNRDDPGATLY